MNSMNKSKTRLHLPVFMALVLIMTLALLPLARVLADLVMNDITVGGNDRFTAGGFTEVNYRIEAKYDNGTDPSNKITCNVTDGSTATLRVNVPTGVTVLPTELVFTACDVSQEVTFKSNIPGSYEITVSMADAGGDYYNTNPAKFTLLVLPPETTTDTTPPVITYVDRTPANGNGWNNGPVTLNWSCADSQSGVVDASVSVTVATEGENQTATGTCVDTAGNTADDTQAGINIDLTAPTITASFSPQPNGSGWYHTAMTVTFAGEDALSGLDSCSSPVDVTTEGANQEAQGSCTDKAGNASIATVSGINIDLTAPVISGAADRAANAAGWYNADVTVRFTCSDALSGVAECTDPVTLGEGANQSVTGTAKDYADNSTNDTVSGINIDNTAPSILWNGAINAGDKFYFGAVPAAPTCAAVDGLSGAAGCVVTGYATTVGTHTLTATAYDNAGNSLVETRAYEVLAWTLKGFYQPVDMGGVYNVVKNGSTVPFKFEVFAGPTELTDPLSVKSLMYAQTACSTTATSDEIETVATGATVLRYDAAAGQFVYNWKTPNTAGACYRVTMTTLDGSSLAAFFRLK